MPFLLDSDVAIHWRDGNPIIRERILALGERPILSAVSRVELENGVYRDPSEVSARRARLDVMLRWLDVVDFTQADIMAYTHILAAAGYSRRKTSDRMIAATALARGFTLLTINSRDFLDIAGLRLEAWDLPDAKR